MITVCIVTYNDMPLIRKCIQSIYKQVDRIIAIDGRYMDFPDIEWYSTDGTIEYLKSLNKIDLRFGAKLFEADKRNLYLDGLKNGQTVLMLDADEEIKGTLREPKADIGIVKFFEPYDRIGQKFATRLFRYRDGMKYSGVHFILTVDNKLFNKRNRAENGFTQENVDDFKIMHLARLRSTTRRYHKALYQRNLTKREAVYKRASFSDGLCL